MAARFIFVLRRAELCSRAAIERLIIGPGENIAHRQLYRFEKTADPVCGRLCAPGYGVAMGVSADHPGISQQDTAE